MIGVTRSARSARPQRSARRSHGRSGGTIVIVGLLANKLKLSGRPWEYIQGIDIIVGRYIVGIFFVARIGAVGYWGVRKYDEKYGEHRNTQLSSPQDGVGPRAAHASRPAPSTARAFPSMRASVSVEH